METTVEYAVAETVAAAFDYGLIDEGIRDEVKAAARTIHQLSAGVMTGIVAIGKRLIEVKGMIPHGQFVDWIVGEFQIEPRMAQNYMNVAREYGDPQKRNIISLFSPTVAYLLAAPSTPEEARVEVEQAALSGQKVTVETTKKAVAKFTEPKPAKPQPIQYAKIHTLETCVRQWLSIAIGEGGTPDPDTVIDMLKIQSGEPHKSGNWLSLLCQSLIEAEIVWRKADLTQAINNVRDQRRQAKLQAASKKVYVEPEVKAEPTKRMSYAPGYPYDDQGWVIQVLPPGQEVDGSVRFYETYRGDNRKTGGSTGVCATAQDVYEKMRSINEAAAMDVVKPEPTPEPIVEADDPPGYGRNKKYAMRPHEEYYPVKHGPGVMPADLVAAGYVLVDRDGKGNPDGKLGYRWRLGDEMGTDVAYAGYAIEAAREHLAANTTPDELAAVALVAAEQVEEDAERAARDATRPSFENVPEFVEATPIETVTVTMPREIAEHLQRAAAAFRVGDMRLVDQAWLEVALSEALTRKEASE